MADNDKNFGPDLLYCLNCTKFGQFILRKIIKIGAARCQILRLKCTKFNFGWGSTPDPTGGALSAPPDSLAGFKGPTSKGRGREGRHPDSQAQWRSDRVCRVCNAHGASAVGGPKFARRCFLRLTA